MVPQPMNDDCNEESHHYKIEANGWPHTKTTSTRDLVAKVRVPGFRPGCSNGERRLIRTPNDLNRALVLGHFNSSVRRWQA